MRYLLLLALLVSCGGPYKCHKGKVYRRLDNLATTYIPDPVYSECIKGDE